MPAHQPRLKEAGALPVAARALLSVLRERNLSIPAFAIEQNVSRFAVEKVLAGRMKRLSLDLALDLRDAAQAVGVNLPIEAWSLRRQEERTSRRTRRTGR
jgi:hypothetical protein